eukprot:COSAG03_NODE_328_length_8950_cov_24.961021_6_plen_187_part_00
MDLGAEGGRESGRRGGREGEREAGRAGGGEEEREREGGAGEMAWVIGAQKYTRPQSFKTAQLRLVQGCKNILAFSDAFGATPRVFALPVGEATFLSMALHKFGDNVDELLDFLRDSFDVDERLRLREAVLTQYGVEEDEAAGGKLTIDRENKNKRTSVQKSRKKKAAVQLQSLSELAQGLCLCLFV